MTTHNTTADNGAESTTQNHWASNAANVSAVLALFFLPISTSALYVALLGVVCFWFIAGQLQEKAKVGFLHPVTRICFGLFVVFLLGSLYSAGTQKDIFDAFSKMSKLLYIPFLIPIFRDKKWRDRALFAFFAAMAVSLTFGLLKLTLGIPLMSLRHASPATVFKSYIDTNLMMAFTVFVLAQTATLNITKTMKFAVLSLMLLMTIYVLWWSEGRAGYFVFTALWILFCFQHLSIRNSVLGVAALTLLLCCATFFSSTFSERLIKIPQEIQQFKQGDQFTSVGQRLQYFKNTALLAKQRLWLGWGTGSLKQVYGNYAKQNNLFKTENPHNEYLNIFFQLGIVGLATFIGLFAVLFYVSFKLPNFEGHILQGVCVAMGLGCLGNSWLMDFTSGYWFVLMIALCSAAYQTKGASAMISPKRCEV